MKRLVAIMLILTLIFPLAACAGEVTPAVAEPEPTAAPTLEPTPSPTPAPSVVPVVTDTDEDVKHVLVNQLGYSADDAKLAFIRGGAVGAKFFVVNGNNEVKYEGAINESIFDSAAEETVYHGDFSEFKEVGEYRVVVEGIGKSEKFVISEKPYSSLLGDALLFFTRARCGCVLSEETGGKCAHEACHLNMATGLDEDILLDVQGGWHDAGDYGRYTVSAAKAVTDLMLAYSQAPEAFEGMAVLDEIDNELAWLMKMQRADGAVYHKVTSEKFSGDIVPDEDDAGLILCPPSSCATADFAAVMALGYGIFKDADQQKASAMLKAAKKAYTYISVNPSSGEFENPAGIKTSEYSDASDSDERLFAAVALYTATGEDEYHQDAKALLFAGDVSFDGFGWQDMSGYAHMLYLRLDEKMRDAAVAEAVKQGVIAAADKRVAAIDASGYNIARGSDFKLHSNMYVLADAQLLLLAGELTGSKMYSLNAKYQLDYLLGANSLSMCFVTGYGQLYPKNPHHSLSMAVGYVAKGMLVGGPNAEFGSAPIARRYEDDAASRQTNEVSICLNSALVYVLSAFK